MSRRVTPEGLAAEAARYRRRLSAVLPALVEYQEAELRRRLHGVFEDYEDFERLIGRENVVDAAGRIDVEELELRVRVVLAERPHLAGRVVRGDVGSLA